MEEKERQQEPRERVLNAAEKLFAVRGYSAVTLRDIAVEVGIRHTSLYHHVPGGKEELFVEVTERQLRRHREGLTRATARAPADVRAQLRAVSDWLLSQPPMDIVRMVYSDMPQINPAVAQRLAEQALESLILPIIEVLVQAQQRGEIAHENLGLVGGGLLGMLESLHGVPENVLQRTRKEMGYELIDVMLLGLRPRS